MRTTREWRAINGEAGWGGVRGGSGASRARARSGSRSRYHLPACFLCVYLSIFADTRRKRQEKSWSCAFAPFCQGDPERREYATEEEVAQIAVASRVCSVRLFPPSDALHRPFDVPPAPRRRSCRHRRPRRSRPVRSRGKTHADGRARLQRHLPHHDDFKKVASPLHRYKDLRPHSTGGTSPLKNKNFTSCAQVCLSIQIRWDGCYYCSRLEDDYPSLDGRTAVLVMVAHTLEARQAWTHTASCLVRTEKACKAAWDWWRLRFRRHRTCAWDALLLAVSGRGEARRGKEELDIQNVGRR